MNQYQLLKDSYFGTGGFTTGAYLRKHKRETDEDYMSRRDSAYYLNYFAPIVNSLVDPIFKKKPLRDYTGAASSAVKDFLEDVDRNGTNIHSFMKKAALHAKIYGVSFIVMDNVRSMEEKDMEALRKNKNFPYVYLVDPEDVLDYSMDENGKLTMFKYRIERQEDQYTPKRSIITFTRDGWQVDDETNSALSQSGQYGIGMVPVIPLFSRLLERNTLLPAPDMLSIALTGKALYNHCSWLSEILRNQTFPLLTIPTMDQKELVIGTNNALGYDPQSAHAPNFIAPSSDPATILQTQIHMLIEEMYRMASLSFITGGNIRESGISRQWEFERTNQQLGNFAKQASDTERHLMELFSLWMHKDIRYTITYPNDFGITDVATDLTEAQQVLDLNLSKEMKKEVAKNVLTAYCPDISENRFDEIINSIKDTDEENGNVLNEQDEEDDEKQDKE